MQVIIEARHFNLRDELREYTEKAVPRLEKFYDRIVDVEVTYEGKLNRKEATVKVGVYGQTLVASEIADKFEISLDAALDKLELQLKKYKEKLQAKR